MGLEMGCLANCSLAEVRCPATVWGAPQEIESDGDALVLRKCRLDRLIDGLESSSAKHAPFHNERFSSMYENALYLIAIRYHRKWFSLECPLDSLFSRFFQCIPPTSAKAPRLNIAVACPEAMNQRQESQEQSAESGGSKTLLAQASERIALPVAYENATPNRTKAAATATTIERTPRIPSSSKKENTLATNGTLNSNSFSSPSGTNYSFPSLEDVLYLPREKYCGPTEESNWVIPSRVLVGAFPADIDDLVTYHLLSSILKEGIGVFVSLQEELDPSSYVKEFHWRTGKKLRPYFRDVQKIYEDNSLWTDSSIVRPSRIKFIHFPIRDLSASAADLSIIDLCKSLISLMEHGDRIYIHCWGGHGRTGTVSSVLLGMIYGLSAEEAMDRVQKAHDLRSHNLGVASPQTLAQRLQVARILASPTVRHFLEVRRLQNALPASSSSAVSRPSPLSATSSPHRRLRRLQPLTLLGALPLPSFATPRTAREQEGSPVAEESLRGTRGASSSGVEGMGTLSRRRERGERGETSSLSMPVGSPPLRRSPRVSGCTLFQPMPDRQRGRRTLEYSGETSPSPPLLSPSVVKVL